MSHLIAQNLINYFTIKRCVLQLAFRNVGTHVIM